MKRTILAGLACVAALCIIVLSVCIDSARAVTFPIIYEGTVQVRASLPAGSCEGDAKMKITLNANGTLRETTDAIISIPGPNKTACEIASLDSMNPPQPWRVHEGTHDKAGRFSFNMSYVTVAGTFGDQQISGTGTGSDGFVTETYTFTLFAQGCGSAKIPLPKGVEIFSPDRSATPRLGVAPAAINPLGVGALALPVDFSQGNLDKTASLRISFCPFEKPVDIYVAYSGADLWYLLDSSGKASSVLNGVKPWRSNVSGAINVTLSPDFGGLFPVPGKLPKGGNQFYVFVTPPNGGFDNVYGWVIDAPVNCGTNNTIPQPKGQEFFVYNPTAALVPGVKPSEIRPLAIGPAALGGSLVHMYTDGCPFEGEIDMHFGVFCASTPMSMFFLQDFDDPRIRTRDDLLQELVVTGATVELPAPAYPSEHFDDIQESPRVFYAGFDSGLPTDTCYYAMAVTPHNVRDKFYLWAVPFNRNIKESLKDLWWGKTTTK